MFLHIVLKLWVFSLNLFVKEPERFEILKVFAFKDCKDFLSLLWRDVQTNKGYQRLFKTEPYTFENINVACYWDVTKDRMSTAL